MVRHHFGQLLKFSGRENKAQFWPWAAIVIALMIVATFATMVPLMAGSFAKMQQFAQAHPDQATVVSGPGHYEIQIRGNHPELMPDVTSFIGPMAALILVAALLLASAVTRRLHDTGRRGWWGLLPLPFLCTGFVLMPRMFSAREMDLRLFGLLFLNNLVYLASLALLAVLLALPSKSQANQSGPPPAV